MTERQFLAQDYAVQLARTWEEALIKIAAVRPDMLVIGAADGGVGLPTRSALSGVPAVLVVRKEELAGYRAHPHPWAAIIARPLEPLSFLKAVRGAMT